MIQSTGLLLAPHKKRALLDFLSTYPAMLTECASRQIIQDGFVRSGLIRKNMNGTIHPGVSICTCINTCQKARLSEDSFNRIKECVIRCFAKFFLEGECSDDDLHRIGGLPYDKDKEGNITTIFCSYDPDTLGKNPADGRKVKGVIHFVECSKSIPAEFKIYDRLFLDANPSKFDDISTILNPNSLIIKNGYVESNLKNAKVGKAYQFEREGYFCRDKTDEALVFNKTVGLRDTWNQ